jgi:hypothetical protein
MLMGAALVTATVAARPAVAANELLKGLKKGFDLEVERIDTDGRKAGLSESALRKVVLSHLEKKGIAEDAAGAQLYARVVVIRTNAVSGEPLGYGAHVELSLREKVRLARDNAIEFQAPTWFMGDVTVANQKEFVGRVTRALGDLTDQFVTDWRKANGG